MVVSLSQAIKGIGSFFGKNLVGVCLLRNYSFEYFSKMFHTVCCQNHFIFTIFVHCFLVAIQQRAQIRNHEGVYRRASMPGGRTLLWNRVEYRAIFTMGMIMGTFVACWLPFFIVNVLSVS